MENKGGKQTLIGLFLKTRCSVQNKYRTNVSFSQLSNLAHLSRPHVVILMFLLAEMPAKTIVVLVTVLR